MLSGTSHVHGYVIPGHPPPDTGSSASIVIYGYVPSLALGILGVVLFLIALTAHLYLITRHRTWYFSTFVVGTAMEIVGYIARILSSQDNPYSIPYYVVQYFFIVVAPVMFSAAIYAVASVLINTYGRQYAPFSPRVVLGLFITCDVAATVVQVVGASLVGAAYRNQSLSSPATYNKILLSGLAFQVFSFAVFLVVLTWTLVKARKSPAKVNKGFLTSLIVATVAVYLRTCFRLAETAQGLMSYLSTHEVFFGCLEFLPIVVAVFLFTYWHPGRWLECSAMSTVKRFSEDEVKPST